MIHTHCITTEGQPHASTTNTINNLHSINANFKYYFMTSNDHLASALLAIACKISKISFTCSGYSLSMADISSLTYLFYSIEKLRLSYFRVTKMPIILFINFWNISFFGGSNPPCAIPAALLAKSSLTQYSLRL